MKKLLSLFIIFNIYLHANNEIVIDVRTPQEFQLGHIKDSINIEWQDIEKVKNMATKEQKIYLYCRSGNRSQKATDILVQLGYVDVENLGSISDAANFLNVKPSKPNSSIISIPELRIFFPKSLDSGSFK